MGTLVAWIAAVGVLAVTIVGIASPLWDEAGWWSLLALVFPAFVAFGAWRWGD